MTIFTNQIEIRINEYVSCWNSSQSPFNLNNGILESCDMGCEHLQIFRKDFDINELDFEDLCNLSWLLTRSLRAQVNRDQFVYWTWCGFVANFFKNNFHLLKNPNNLFNDSEWIHSFSAIINLLLMKQNNTPPLGRDPFLDRFWQYRHVIAGPLVYSLLEGLLRRKNSEYVNKEGKTIQPFQLNRKNKNNQNYGRFKINKSINSIPLLFQILEELTIPIHRSHRQITGLRELESESASFINDSKDFYESIYAGRNSLLHGEKYWQTRVPILMNLICLLLVDSIDRSFGL